MPEYSEMKEPPKNQDNRKISSAKFPAIQSYHFTRKSKAFKKNVSSISLNRNSSYSLIRSKTNPKSRIFNSLDNLSKSTIDLKNFKPISKNLREILMNLSNLVSNSSSYSWIMEKTLAALEKSLFLNIGNNCDSKIKSILKDIKDENVKAIFSLGKVDRFVDITYYECLERVLKIFRTLDLDHQIKIETLNDNLRKKEEKIQEWVEKSNEQQLEYEKLEKKLKDTEKVSPILKFKRGS